VLDGVYGPSESGPVFVEAPRPSEEDAQAVLRKIVGRILKMPTRRGALVDPLAGVRSPDPALLQTLLARSLAEAPLDSREFDSHVSNADLARLFRSARRHGGCRR
jgi:hypothetical protein